MSNALVGIGQPNPGPILMSLGTWGLLPGLEQPSRCSDLPMPSPHKKALEAMGPSCAAGVLRPGEQAAWPSEISSPQGREEAAEGISLGWHKKFIFHVSGTRPKLPGVILTSIHSKTIPKKVSYLPPQTDTYLTSALS